jgi:radical SAM superfamily enzyme YgiQ (UPF0313 family)
MKDFIMDGKQNSPCNILLIYPRIPQGTYWSYANALRLVGKKAIFPPLGLPTVAAMMPDNCNCRLIDMNVQRLTDSDLQWADAVFVSAMIVQKESMEDIIRRARKMHVPIVAGGPYPSTSYRDIEGVDHFVIGEAEDVLSRFWQDFIRGRALHAYARPVDEKHRHKLLEFFQDDADIEISPTRPDIDNIPIPRFELLKMQAYWSMAVQASRGCPVGCEFCYIWRRFGRKPRYKSIGSLMAEFDTLYRLGWRGDLFIVDDNFVANRKCAKALLTAIAEWQQAHGYPYDLSTAVTLTLADDKELLRLFRIAGFDLVFVGIETPAEESLKEARKLINIKGSIAEKVGQIQEHGIQVTAGFILGFDNDPCDIADRIIGCIQDLGIPSAMVGLLQALPETDLYDRLEKESRLHTMASGNNTHDFQINFRTVRLEYEVINDYKRILKAIYPDNMKSYFDRCRVLRRRWHGLKRPVPKARVLLCGLLIVARYILRMLMSSYRWEGLKFLADTLLHKPSFFPFAVGLGVHGHHYRNITRTAFEVAEMENYFSEQLSRFSELSRTMQETASNTDMSGERLLAHLLDNAVHFINDRKQIFAGAAVRMRAMSSGDRLSAAVRYDQFIAQAAILLEEKGRVTKDAVRRMKRLRRDARQAACEKLSHFSTELEHICLALLPSPVMIQI